MRKISQLTQKLFCLTMLEESLNTRLKMGEKLSEDKLKSIQMDQLQAKTVQLNQ